MNNKLLSELEQAEKLADENIKKLDTAKKILQEIHEIQKDMIEVLGVIQRIKKYSPEKDYFENCKFEEV